MSVFAWLLWTSVSVLVAGPVPRAAFSEGEHSLSAGHDGAQLRPSFLHLPMFHHAPGPLVIPELFRPVSRQRSLPAGLTALLFPPRTESQRVHETGARAVEVWCGVDKVSVRVDRLLLRFWTVPSLFRLGSCQPSKIRPRFLYFHYELTECDGEAKVVGGQLVYAYLLTYTPPPQDYVLRVVPLNFPIHCQYDRFHYSYQVGFRPQLQHTTFMKSLRTKLRFSLTVCDARWEPISTGHWFFLGEQVHFVAQTGALLAGERLYVESCYATTSRGPDNTTRLDIISNYGCMTDSRREGSRSQFLSREANVLKFSVDAFLFKAVSQMLYLHCSMAVGLATSVKSCNYNKAAGRWEELEATTSVCSCCDSLCPETQHSMEDTVSSPGWLIRQKADEKPRFKDISFQARDEEDQLNKEDKSGEKMGENLKGQTFTQRTKTYHKEIKEVLSKKMSLLPDMRNKWRHSSGVSWWGKKERESETEQQTDGLVEEFGSHSSIMSDQSRPQEHEKQDREAASSIKSDSVSGSSSNNRSSSPSWVTFATTTDTRNYSFSIDPTNNHGLDENLSSAVIPIVKPCPNKTSCSGTKAAIKPEWGSNHAAQSTMESVGAESSTSYNGSITTAPSSSDSARYSSVHPGQFDDGLETLTLTRPATGDLKFDLPAPVKRLKKSKLESYELNTLLNVEELKPVNKSLNAMSDGTPEQAVDSVISKGTDGDKDVLNDQIRGLESDQSAHPTWLRDPSCVDRLLCKSDFDSGIEEGKGLHQSQFTQAVRTQREAQTFTGNIARRHRVSLGSARSETIQGSPSHSAVVAVSTLQGAASQPTNNRDWSKALPYWGLQNIWFLVAQPNEF